MTRRRRRDRDVSEVSRREVLDTYLDARSVLARHLDAIEERVSRVTRPVVSELRRVARPPVRSPRLRSPALQVSRGYVSLTPHRTVREVKRCLKEKLSDARERQGSGGGRSRVRQSRNESRRQLFQAVRKSC